MSFTELNELTPAQKRNFQPKKPERRKVYVTLATRKQYLVTMRARTQRIFSVSSRPHRCRLATRSASTRSASRCVAWLRRGPPSVCCRRRWPTTSRCFVSLPSTLALNAPLFRCLCLFGRRLSQVRFNLTAAGFNFIRVVDEIINPAITVGKLSQVSSLMLCSLDRFNLKQKIIDSQNRHLYKAFGV